MKTILLATALVAGSLASGSPGQEPVHPQIEALQQILEQYRKIRDEGGWPMIKTNKKYFMEKQKDPAVKTIKHRLRITGDFDALDSSDLFTAELAEAVKAVQLRFGFKNNGVVDAQLIRELNVPVEARIRQLEVNIQRLESDSSFSEGIRLVANIPEFKLHVYNNGEHQFDMDIVVGTKSNKTVIFEDEMTHIVFSPYWNVPPSIVESEILPAMRKSRNYLKRNGYEKVGTENGLPVIRQKPGPHNSLGLVKFVFPNDHNIYFHDTPAKSLFELRKRTFSHGCIRLAEARKLAEYLLRDDPDWTPSAIGRAMQSNKEQWVELAAPVAVSLTYFTAWADEEGKIHFREDVYGYDKAPKLAQN